MSWGPDSLDERSRVDLTVVWEAKGGVAGRAAAPLLPPLALRAGTTLACSGLTWPGRLGRDDEGHGFLAGNHAAAIGPSTRRRHLYLRSSGG
jgi:hypothetical protein